MAAFPPDLPQLLAEVEDYASTVREAAGMIRTRLWR